MYRTYEAVMHYGDAIKSIINEQCGDPLRRPPAPSHVAPQSPMPPQFGIRTCVLRCISSADGAIIGTPPAHHLESPSCASDLGLLEMMTALDLPGLWIAAAGIPASCPPRFAQQSPPRRWHHERHRLLLGRWHDDRQEGREARRDHAAQPGEVCRECVVALLSYPIGLVWAVLAQGQSSRVPSARACTRMRRPAES